MRSFVLGLVLAVVILVPARTAAAQEVQVPMDREGTVYAVGADQAEELGLFRDYEGFQEARLYATGDSLFTLEITYRPAGELLRDRRALTPSAVEMLRARVSAALPAGGQRVRLDQEGRAALLRRLAAVSVFLYGPTAASLSGLDETAASALFLTTSSAGFFIPYFLTRDRAVSRGSAQLAGTGMVLGGLHGLAARGLLWPDNGSEKGILAVASAASIGEGLAGYYFAKKAGMSKNTALTIGSGGWWGGALGLELAAVLSFNLKGNLWGDDGEDDRFSESIEDNTRLFSGVGLAGSIAGLSAGYALSRSEPFTLGDNRILNTTGALGTFTGLSVAALSQTENGRVVVGSMLAGTLAGLGTGVLLTHDHDFASGEGALIAAGTSAAGIGGLAVARMVGADERSAPAFVSAGAAVGFAAMYLTFANQARPTLEVDGWDFQIVPPMLLQVPGPQGAGSRMSPAPGVSLSGRF